MQTGHLHFRRKSRSGTLRRFGSQTYAPFFIVKDSTNHPCHGLRISRWHEPSVIPFSSTSGIPAASLAPTTGIPDAFSFEDYSSKALVERRNDE